MNRKLRRDDGRRWKGSVGGAGSKKVEWWGEVRGKKEWRRDDKNRRKEKLWVGGLRDHSRGHERVKVGVGDIEMVWSRLLSPLIFSRPESLRSNKNLHQLFELRESFSVSVPPSASDHQDGSFWFFTSSTGWAQTCQFLELHSGCVTLFIHISPATAAAWNTWRQTSRRVHHRSQHHAAVSTHLQQRRSSLQFSSHLLFFYLFRTVFLSFKNLFGSDL